MEKTDFNNKSKEDLLSILSDKRKDLIKYVFEVRQSKLKDSSFISKTKKDIARILTILNRKD